MSKYKVGIIGCGNIFPMHAVSVKRLDETEIVAVCDIKEDKADKRAKEFNCESYYDYEKMIDNEDLDVIHICTPHYLHHPMAVYAAQAGVNILTEKPMSIKLENARDMVQTADENNVTLGVIFQNRYNPGSKLIKDTLESGELGEILSGKLSVTWDRSDEYYTNSDWKGTWDKEGGGVLIDQAIHTMDLMRWFVNDEIDYIDATISNRAHDIIEVEDAAEGVIKYDNGIFTAFHTINYYTYDAPVEIELHCENGLAKIVKDKGIVELENGKKYVANRNPNETFDYGDVKSYWGVSHIKQINNYYESLQKGVKPDIAGTDAIKTQEMICAIYESGKKEIKVEL